MLYLQHGLTDSQPPDLALDAILSLLPPALRCASPGAAPPRRVPHAHLRPQCFSVSREGGAPPGACKCHLKPDVHSGT